MIRKFSSLIAIAAGCLFGSSALSADDFRPVPNAVKYRDSGVPNAKGSSGSASIEVRALLNKDTTTDVELTTAVFEEPGSATATIKNVRVELSGQVHDFTGNDGNTFAATGFTGLGPGAPVGVHANVKDLNGNNENVKAATAVKKRPDLTFVWISSTQHVMVGMPVEIVATIYEQNRQTGARADCVAYLDGVEIDRAENIWVDAGGTVDCVLSPAISEPGWKNILVKLEKVRPADWDMADNQVYAITTVHAYNEELNYWNAIARDETFTYLSRYYSATSEEMWRTSGWYSSAGISASQPELLDPTTMTMDFSITTDGVSFSDVRGLRFIGWQPGEDFSCGRAFVGATRATICTMQFPWEIGTNRGHTQISAATGNGDVTYYSRYWSLWYDRDGTPHSYTYESSGREQTGTEQRLGNTVAMRMSITDGTRTLWAEPFITLQAREFHDGYDRCYEWGGCEEYRRDLVMKFGTASGGIVY